MGGKFFKWRFEIEAVGVGAEFERALENRGAGTRAKAAVKKRARPIGDDPGRIEIVLRAEAIARGARSVRRIEAEGARFKLRNGNAAIGAGEFLRESVFLAADDGHGDEAVRQFERGGDGLLEARGDALLDEQAVDDDFDGVVLALVDDWKFIKLVKLAVDAHAEVIVNFRDGANGRTRRARGGFLLDSDRRRKPFDHVDFGALHLVEELARVGGKRFDVTALAFGIDRVEGERRFAGAGEAGDDREGVPGNFDADILEVMLARAPDYQFGQAHETNSLPPQEPWRSVGTLSPR